MSENAEMNFISKCAAVVVDVAGTTTSIKYVQETLFPYAEKNCDGYLKENFEKDEVKKALKLLKDDIPDVPAAITAFKEQSAGRSENEGIKLLQGFIYKDGYTSGKLKAHVYADVPSALETWAKSMKVAIYSSGSAESQQLLFSHTAEGDLSAQIARYFDQTTIGKKTAKGSYEKIAKELQVKPEQVLFISDDVKELNAAKEAKLFTVLMKREGNDAVSEDEAKEHCVVDTFADLVGTGKRKCPVDEATEMKQPPTKLAKTDESNKSQPPTEAPEDPDKMEVDSTTESKKTDDKTPPQPEQATDATKIENNDQKNTDKEAEITSTNDEAIKTQNTIEEPPRKSQPGEEIKQPSSADSTEDDKKAAEEPLEEITAKETIVEEDVAVANGSVVEEAEESPQEGAQVGGKENNSELANGNNAEDEVKDEKTPDDVKVKKCEDGQPPEAAPVSVEA